MSAAESDLRGEVALAILAYLTWAEFHGGAGKLLDGSVASWLTVGRPADPGITRALVKVRGMLARYVGAGGAVPSWFPKALREAINETPNT